MKQWTTVDGISFNTSHVTSFKNADDFVKNEQQDSKSIWAEIWGLNSTQTDDKLKVVYSLCKPETAKEETPKKTGK